MVMMVTTTNNMIAVAASSSGANGGASSSSASRVNRVSLHEPSSLSSDVPLIFQFVKLQRFLQVEHSYDFRSMQFGFV